MVVLVVVKAVACGIGGKFSAVSSAFPHRGSFYVGADVGIIYAGAGGAASVVVIYQAAEHSLRVSIRCRLSRPDSTYDYYLEIGRGMRIPQTCPRFWKRCEAVERSPNTCRRGRSRV